MMDDMYETLAQIVPAIAQMLTPPQVQAVVSMLIESSPLPANAKRQFRNATIQSQQPNPMQQQAQVLQLQGAQAKINETNTNAQLNVAKAQAQQAKAMQPPPQPAAQQQKFELPPDVQVADAMSKINKTQADAFHKRALGAAEVRASSMVPLDYAQRTVDAMHTRRYDHADLMMRAFEALAARPPPTVPGAVTDAG